MRLILILGALAWAIAIIPSQALGSLVFIESGGQVVVEAENFSTRTPVNSQNWVRVPNEEMASPFLVPNSRGDGYIQALPDQGNTSFSPSGPSVEYTTRISTVGEYYLYTRWEGFNVNSDTIYASIKELSDGPGGVIPDWYRYVKFVPDVDFATPGWQVSGAFEGTDSPGTGASEPPVSWIITQPGDYTIQFDMREDGAAIDAFVFQLASLSPPTGNGPTVTSTVPVPSTVWLFSSGLFGLVGWQWWWRTKKT